MYEDLSSVYIEEELDAMEDLITEEHANNKQLLNQLERIRYEFKEYKDKAEAYAEALDRIENVLDEIR